MRRAEDGTLSQLGEMLADDWLFILFPLTRLLTLLNMYPNRKYSLNPRSRTRVFGGVVIVGPFGVRRREHCQLSLKRQEIISKLEIDSYV